ncbi:Fe-S oxidoreductase [Cryobacterium sp. PAMC25264]|uniref:Fe-S oxidoreductase n=1 Tax=Cryobacterium sp. PAMC25264 TaxID=2861288 RepID=UPI001C62BD14|nr:Fe-S oxidoreductase [Cryobacterium sp. PAMC25264]QYF73933.1 Fe-S oxidoreductase [Cryobacterium sp. PAMC25264]
MRRILFDSPLSRAGYLYATTVGLIWGAIWSTGRIERRNGLVVFRGLPAWAFGRGGSCVGAVYLTNQNVTADVLEHEAVHKVQWQRYGMLFPLLYFIAGRDPLKNRYEIEAGLEKGGYLRKKRVVTRAPRDRRASTP